MKFIVATYLSPEYGAMVSLRNEILRKPIGLSITEEDIKKEENDIFISRWDNNQIIGCCILTKQNNATVKLRQMAVSNNHQRLGIGATILAFAEQKAKEENFFKIELHARKSALNFYLKYGYKVVGDEFTEVGIPHFPMEKDL